MKLYHAAGENYKIGEDLCSLLTLVEKGIIEDPGPIMDRWEVSEDYLFADGSIVSFTSDLNEAFEIRSLYNGGKGVILCVESDDLEGATTNDEGYPASRFPVPFELLTVVS